MLGLMRCFALTTSLAVLLCACSRVQSEVDTSVTRDVPQTSSLWDHFFSGAALPEVELPVITGVSSLGDDEFVEVSLMNPGTDSLDYFGYSKTVGQSFLEERSGSKWECGNWDWCGTGMEQYSIAPGDSVTLKVRLPDSEHPVRSLTPFRNRVTGEFAMVVLAERAN